MRTRMSLERRMRLLLSCTGEWRSPSRTCSVSFEVFINQIFLTWLVGKSVLPSGRPLSWRTCSERLWKSPARITSKRSTRQGTESGWCCTSTNQGMSEILKTLDRTQQMFFKQTVLFCFFSLKLTSRSLSSPPTSVPLCALINQHLCSLARKFPQTKFLKSISTTCIPNYPDHNLPTIFVYFEGDMKAQYIGPLVFGGMNLKADGRPSWSNTAVSTWLYPRASLWRCQLTVGWNCPSFTSLACCTFQKVLKKKQFC